MATPLRLTRVEVWSDLQCAGGVRLAMEREVLAARESRELAGIEKLTVTVPTGGRGWAAAAHERVLRTYLSDGSWEEWRISNLDDQREEDGALRATIEATSPLLDLGDTDEAIVRTEANGLVQLDFGLFSLTPVEHLAFILQSAPGHWRAGTVDPTKAVDLNYGWDSPLSALRQLAELAAADLLIERDGTTGYRVHLRARDVAAPAGARIRYAKNQKGVSRKRDGSQLFTRAYPRGAAVDGTHADMTEAAWRVLAAAGGTITLEDGVVAFSGQLDGLYAEDAATGYRTAIVASGTDQVLQLAAPGTIGVGSLILVRRDADGAALPYLDNPGAAARYLRPGRHKHRVVDLPDIPGINNLVENPFLDTWDGVALQGWGKVGAPEVAKETAQLYRRFGGASVQVIAADDGVGIETGWIPIAPTEAHPFFSAQITLWCASGAARLELLAQDANGTTLTFPSGGASANTNVVGSWTDQLAVGGINLHEVGATRAKLRVIAHKGAARFFLDAAQLTQTASGADTFYSGRSACELWREANRALAEHQDAEEVYEISLVDLQRIDPNVFAGDAIRLGELVWIDDIAMGVRSAARIVQFERDLLVPGAIQITLSNRAPGITGQLTGSARRNRNGSAPPATTSRERTILAEYASDALGSNASTIFDPDIHTYWRWSLDGGDTWTDWALFVGESGVAGDYLDYRFRAATSKPATPTGTSPSGWSDAPPTPAAGQYLWMSSVWRSGETGLILPGEVWSDPVRLTGDQGPPGTPGLPALRLDLSNETHTIPAASDGSGAVYTGANTTATIYAGSVDDTAAWAITASPSAGVTGTLSGRTYSVTGMTVDSGFVDFVAKRSGYPDLPARFTLTRVRSGNPGDPATAYMLSVDAAAIKRSLAGALTPAGITVSGTKATGTLAPVPYSGRFKIFTIAGGTETLRYTSTVDQASYTYTPAAGIVAAMTGVRVQFFLAGGVTTLLDEEVIPVVEDGPQGPIGLDGPQGPKGVDGSSIRWRGESTSAPSSPQLNDCYRNSTTGIVYIYNGTAWVIMTTDGDDGADGAAGADGLSVFITYHDNPIGTPPATPTGNGTTGGWHTTPTAAAIWMSQKVAASASAGTWGTPMRLRGDQGAPGVAACSIKLEVATAEPNHTVTLTVFPTTATVSATLNSANKTLTPAGAGKYTVVLTRSLTADQRLLVQAEASGYASGTATYSIDRDSTPGLTSVAAPVPVFDGSTQTGWLLTGGADDDATSIGVALSGGLTILRSTPAVVGGAMNVASVKTWSLTLSQTPGSTGTVALTPKAGTVQGVPWSTQLSLSPRTTITITDNTTVLRRITLHAVPGTARINARAIRASDGSAVATYLPNAAGSINRTAVSKTWRQVVGPGLTFFVDLAEVGGAVVLEFYSTTTTSAEAVQSQRIDADSEPSVGITATGVNNIATVTATPDDDLVIWRMWAKRAAGAGSAWPTVTGLDSGEPDDRYRIFEGAQHNRTVTWWAKEGTWYLLARAYDYAGQYTTTTYQFTVTAGASTDAALSALAVARQDNTPGPDYHVITWSRTSNITSSSGHLARIMEGGVQVAQVGAHLNTAKVATPDQKAGPGPGAVWRRYEYTVLLLNNVGSVISSYPLVVEGWYDDGTVPLTPPTQTPGVPTLTVRGTQTSAAWTNTSTVHSIEVEWWRDGAQFTSTMVAPGVSTVSVGAFISGDLVKARVRYTNEAGLGTWSSFSSEIVV